MTTVAGQPRLKDLPPEEFERRYSCDRFTATVLASRYRYLVKHMCTHLVQNAFSPILRDWYDFSATLKMADRRLYQAKAAGRNSVA